MLPTRTLPLFQLDVSMKGKLILLFYFYPFRQHSFAFWNIKYTWMSPNDIVVNQNPILHLIWGLFNLKHNDCKWKMVELCYLCCKNALTGLYLCVAWLKLVFVSIFKDSEYNIQLYRMWGRSRWWQKHIVTFDWYEKRRYTLLHQNNVIVSFSYSKILNTQKVIRREGTW